MSLEADLEKARNLVDASVNNIMAQGRTAGVSVIDIMFIDQVFRPYLKLLEECQIVQRDPEETTEGIKSMLNNMIGELTVRQVKRSDAAGAIEFLNKFMKGLSLSLADFIQVNYISQQPPATATKQ